MAQYLQCSKMYVWQGIHTHTEDPEQMVAGQGVRAATCH
jgi:hypothetical protein